MVTNLRDPNLLVIVYTRISWYTFPIDVLSILWSPPWGTTKHRYTPTFSRISYETTNKIAEFVFRCTSLIVIRCPLTILELTVINKLKSPVWNEIKLIKLCVLVITISICQITFAIIIPTCYPFQCWWTYTAKVEFI